MKKLIFLILSEIFFSLSFTNCLWCQLDDEADFLPNTDFYIVPEKDSYSLDEELLLTFSSIPNFSTFDKYTFEICSKEYDTDKKEYLPTDNLLFMDSNSRELKKSINFEYEEKDVESTSKVKKVFFVKVSKKGKFVCYIHGDGWSFNDKGGCSALGYDKRIYIDVIE